MNEHNSRLQRKEEKESNGRRWTRIVIEPISRTRTLTEPITILLIPMPMTILILPISILLIRMWLTTQ